MPAPLQRPAGFLKSRAIGQRLKEHMAVHILQPLGIKRQNSHLFGLADELDVVAVGVLNDLIMPE